MSPQTVEGWLTSQLHKNRMGRAERNESVLSFVAYTIAEMMGIAALYPSYEAIGFLQH